MKKPAVHLALLALLALGTTQALAQQAAGSGLRMPYERDFWGYVGGSLGGARLDTACPPGGSCDDSDQSFRVFGGGKMSNQLGAEIGFVKLGDFARAGGETDAKGLDIALIGGFPLGTTSSVFAKAGLVYGRTQVSGTAPGLQTGKANGWGPRIGIGATIGLTPNWAVRLDADRYRFKLPAGRDNIDTLTVGVQYSFR